MKKGEKTYTNKINFQCNENISTQLTRFYGMVEVGICRRVFVYRMDLQDTNVIYEVVKVIYPLIYRISMIISDSFLNLRCTKVRFNARHLDR